MKMQIHSLKVGGAYSKAEIQWLPRYTKWFSISATVAEKKINIHIFFFCYQQFFIFIFSHITQHNIQNITKQNKTTDTYSTSQGPIKREGEREGQQKHKSHSSIQSRTSIKKHCQASMVEGLATPTRAVVHSNIHIF